MPTYADYQKQIAELKAAAERTRKDEISKACADIKAIMDEYGITLADLSSTQKTVRKASKPVEIKYRNNETGETWTGRGRAPRWLEGKKKEDFLV